MKTKTLHLNDGSKSYCVVDDVVYVLDVDPDCDWPDMTWPDMTWQPTKYRVGEAGILCSSTNIRTGSISFRLVFDCPDGIPGNSNPNITRFHGWRGTYNNISNDAHGLREIIKIRELKNGTIAVTVGPDIAPERD